MPNLYPLYLNCNSLQKLLEGEIRLSSKEWETHLDKRNVAVSTKTIKYSDIYIKQNK